MVGEAAADGLDSNDGAAHICSGRFLVDQCETNDSCSSECGLNIAIGAT